MKKTSLKSKALITAISALSVTGTAVVAAQAKMYTVKAGDSLWSLSQKSGLSVSDLASRNNIVNPNLIVAGQTLDIPDQAASAAATPAEKAVAASSSASVATAAPAANSSAASGTISYTVKAGDSLWQIAQNTGADVNELLQANGGKSLINIGQVLQINLSADAQAAPASQASSSASADQSAAASSAAASAAQSAYSASVAASQAAALAAASAYDASSAAAASAASASQAAYQAAQSTAASQAASASAAAKPAPAVQPKTAAPATPLAAPVQNSASVSAVINLAVQMTRQHIPYVWGGKTPAGFDCSGFVSYVLQHAAGISIPSYTVSQESYVTKKPVSQAQPGDLLFWGDAGNTYHVAIYIGNGQYAAAPEPGMDVEIEPISSYFMPSFAGTVIR